MNRIRFLLIFTIAWLFFIINIDTIAAQTSLVFLYIHPVVFMMVIGIFFIALALPETNQLPHNLVVMGLIGIYGILQLIVPRSSLALEASILHTGFEIGVLAISYILYQKLSGWFVNYNKRLQDVAFSSVESVITSTFSDIDLIEKKISRARRFEHELSIVHVDLSSVMLTNKLSKTASKYLFSSHLAEMLQMVTSKSIAKSWYNNNLVLCIPSGANSPQVSLTIANLKAVLGDVLKVQADVTTASFPQDGLVLSDLVENATNHHQLAQSHEKRAVVYTLPKMQSQMSS